MATTPQTTGKPEPQRYAPEAYAPTPGGAAPAPEAYAAPVPALAGAAS
ncbi:MAG: hypothetical protein U0T02_01745 [Solirubrobacteraceae bacterium]